MWLNFKNDNFSYNEVCYYIVSLYQMFQERIYLNISNLKSLDKIEKFIKKYNLPVIYGGLDFLENIALEINYYIQDELYMWDNNTHTVWLFDNEQLPDMLQNMVVVEKNEKNKNNCYLSFEGEEDKLFVRVKKMKKN